MPKRSTVTDFWNRVQRGEADECWPWTSYRDKRGYGQLHFQGQKWQAHRLAWLLTFGDPGELNVLHRCDNPPCCNPAHLFLGTIADNNADMIAKGRGWSPRLVGADHGMAKLTEADVLAIRALHASGGTYLGIAAQFGVHRSNVSLIVRRVTWTHL